MLFSSSRYISSGTAHFRERSSPRFFCAASRQLRLLQTYTPRPDFLPVKSSTNSPSGVRTTLTSCFSLSFPHSPHIFSSVSFYCQSDPSFRKGFLFLSLSFFLSLFLLALYSFIEAAFGAYVYLEACELCGELRILTLVAYSK